MLASIFDIPAWVTAGGAALAAVAVPVLIWSLLGDWISRRARREPRCPKCWYSMRGAPSLKCPECGFTAVSAKQLLKSRRRWRRAAVASLLILGGTLTATLHRLLLTGWAEVAPTSLLLLLNEDPMPVSFAGVPNVERAVVVEIWKRYAEGRLSASQKRRLTQKQFAASGSPVSVLTRPRWPAGVPVLYYVTNHFGGCWDRDLRATHSIPGGSDIVTRLDGQRSVANLWPARTAVVDPTLQTIGTPPSGTTSIPFNVEICESGTPIWTGNVSTATAIGGEIDDIIEPVASGELNRALSEELTQHLFLSQDAAWLRIDVPKLEGFDSVTFGVWIEFFHGGSSVAKSQAIWTVGLASQIGFFGLADNSELWRPIQGDLSRLREADLSDPQWHVRVRGSGVLALSEFSATHYWDGEITLAGNALQRLP